MRRTCLLVVSALFLGTSFFGTANAQEICRTAGFWGTHAGTEKNNSTNISEGVMEGWLFTENLGFSFPTQCDVDETESLNCNFEPPGPAGSPKACRDAKKNDLTLLSSSFPNGIDGLNICGKTIGLNPEGNAIPPVVEALCVRPNESSDLQLARQLTAAALNCIMSGGGTTCEGTSIGTTFSACNAACNDPNQAGQISLCIEQVDCFNNGGQWNEDDPNAMYCQLDVPESCHANPLTFTIGGGGPILQ